MRTKATWPRLLVVLLFLFVFYPLLASQAAEKASVQQILTNPNTYDGKEILLEGKATQIRLMAAREGNEYATFTLSDDSGKGIRIIVWGHPAIKKGQRVTVTGVYQKVKKVGRYEVYDEVEAKEIR